MNDLVTDKDSVTMQRRRNEQTKRWNYHLAQRLKKGLPAYAPQMPAKEFKRIYDFEEFERPRPVV